MSTVKEIQAAIPKLSREEIEQIREWIDDYLEDHIELTKRSESQAGPVPARDRSRRIYNAAAKIDRGRRAPDLVADILQRI